MTDFDMKVSNVVCWLSAYGVTEEWINQFRSIYAMLQSFLELSNQPYDGGVGRKWLRSVEESLDSMRLLYAILSVNLLNEIGTTGCGTLKLSGLNAWPYPEPWGRSIKKFVEYAQTEYSVSWSSQLDWIVRRFALSMQLQGQMQPSNVGWEHLWHAYGMLDSTQNKAYEGCISGVREFLQFLADSGECSLLPPVFASRFRPGMELPVYWRPNGFDFEGRSQKETSGSHCSAEEVLAWANQICLEQKNAKSSKATLLNTRRGLEHYALFLWCNGLGHERDLAAEWLEHVRTESETLYLSARRALSILEESLEAGIVVITPMFMPPPAMESLPAWCASPLKEFLMQREKELLASSTLATDRSSCTRLCRFLIEQGVSGFDTVTPALLKEFNLQDVHRTAAGKATCNGRIRSFLMFLNRAGYISQPNLHLALPNVAAHVEHVVVILNDKEKEAVAARIEQAKTPLELRDAACTLLAAEMGLRGSDIFALTFDDIDWKNRRIHLCQTKTRKEVCLPMPASVGNAIYRYLKDGRSKDASSDHVFVSVRAPYAPLGKCTGNDIMKRVLPEHKVPGSKFHINRRTYATQRMRDSVSRDDISALLGHRDQTSLAPYLSLDDERMSLCPLSLKEFELWQKEGESIV